MVLAGELAGRAFGPRRPTVGLGDVQPLVGVRALGPYREVGAVAAAGDQQAEIGGGPLIRCGASAGPKVQRSLDGEVISKRNWTSGTGSRRVR
jgi:hypothetical protein